MVQIIDSERKSVRAQVLPLMDLEILSTMYQNSMHSIAMVHELFLNSIRNERMYLVLDFYEEIYLIEYLNNIVSI